MKRKTCLVCGMLMFIVSCNSSNNRIEVVKRVHYDINSSSDEAQKVGYIEYDSVRFSDGSYATYKLRWAPQNSLAEFVDNKGRRIATIAQASECSEQVIIYKYGSNDKLTNLLYFKEIDTADDEKKYRDWYGDDRKQYYMTFRNRMETVDYEHPDTTLYKQINIDYDKDGQAVKATVVNSGNVIEAPKGYMLDVSVEPCVSFWQSDLHGGYFIFKACVTPKQPVPAEYTLFRYADFAPTLEENYKDGALVRTVVYPEFRYEDSKKETITLTHENGRNVYTISYDGNTYVTKRVWSEGRLLTEQRISQYGTVLEQLSYSYSLPSSQVKVVKEVIDYGKKTLKKVSETYTTLSDIGPEKDEMQPLKRSCYWENVYE